ASRAPARGRPFRILATQDTAYGLRSSPCGDGGILSGRCAVRITRGHRSRTALVLGLAAGIASASVGRGTGAADTEAAGSEAAAALRLVLNTAAFRLHVYENGERIRSYRVAVGKPGHRTPRGAYHISRVIWNPWWHPPNRPWARGKRPVPPGPRNPMGRVKLY